MYLQLFVILVLVAIDRFLKVFMTEYLAGVSRKDFIPKFMHFTYVENTGASFGILKDNTILLTILTSIVLVILLFYIVSRKSQSKVLTASLLLVAAGGIGNLYDRIVYGYVVDYIEFSFMNYAVFNFADSLVNIGAVLLFVYLIFIDRHLWHVKKKEQDLNSKTLEQSNEDSEIETDE